MKKASLVLAFICFFTSALCIRPAGAQTGADDALNGPKILPEVESTIEKTAAVALRRLSQARADIHRNSPSRVRHELSEASLLMNSIRNELSTSPAKNLIAVARNHLVYETPQKVLDDFPAIFDSLARISTYIPTDEAKADLDRARKFLEEDKKADADRELFFAGESLTIVEVERPLLKVRYYVTQAQDYLSSKKPKKADQALERAEKHALMLVNGANLPLYQAEKNIGHATSSLRVPRNDEVAKHLRQAKEDIAKAVNTGNAKGKEEAAKLGKELSALDNQLAAEGKIAVSALQTAWEKSKALSERTIAYLSANISEAKTTLGGEDDLIEAKLHVSYAETYRLTSLDRNKADEEISKALPYLRKATESPLAGPSDQKKLQEIKRLLQSLKSEKDDSTAREIFRKVKQDLDDLIQRV